MPYVTLLSKKSVEKLLAEAADKAEIEAVDKTVSHLLVPCAVKVVGGILVGISAHLMRRTLDDARYLLRCQATFFHDWTFYITV